MGGDTPVYYEKNVLSDFPFIAYLLNSGYEKLTKCNRTFQWDNFFFHPETMTNH